MLQDRRIAKLLILSASLVGVLLAGWLIVRPRSNPAPAAPPGRETASSLSAADAVVSPTRQGCLLREEVRAEPLQPGATQTEAAMSVMHQWALRDANAAMAWAEAFPPGDLRERAINEVKNISAHLSGGQTAF